MDKIDIESIGGWHVGDEFIMPICTNHQNNHAGIQSGTLVKITHLYFEYDKIVVRLLPIGSYQRLSYYHCIYCLPKKPPFKDINKHIVFNSELII